MAGAAGWGPHATSYALGKKSEIRHFDGDKSRTRKRLFQYRQYPLPAVLTN